MEWTPGAVAERSTIEFGIGIGGDGGGGGYPRARTAHAAAVAGDELIVFGGMAAAGAGIEGGYGEGHARGGGPGGGEPPGNGVSGRTEGEDWTSQRSWDGGTQWDALSDVWAFNLKTLTWRERRTDPRLARSYHSLVGREDGTVAAFGGFRTAKTVGGEVSFVSYRFRAHSCLKPPPPSLGFALEGRMGRLASRADPPFRFIFRER